MADDDRSVRAATTADAEAIRRVARAGWHAAYDGILGPDTVAETVDRWYDPDRIAADARRSSRPFFVAVEAGTVVGFAAAADADEPGRFSLYRLYVHPDRWERGVGTRLLDRVVAAVRGRGATELSLSVLAGNDRAVAFYEERGFERIGTVVDESFGVPRHEYVRGV